MRSLRGIVAAALAAVMALPAAAQDRTGVTDTTIKIGIPGPLTGPAASFGAAAYGIQAYYTYINEQGGIHGRKIEIIMGDHACNEAKGVAVAKKLISQDQVFLLNGGICSGVALAMRPVIEESGVPGWSPPPSTRRSPLPSPRTSSMPARPARSRASPSPSSC